VFSFVLLLSFVLFSALCARKSHDQYATFHNTTDASIDFLRRFTLVMTFTVTLGAVR
jgi:hypothetical protein